MARWAWVSLAMVAIGCGAPSGPKLLPPGDITVDIRPTGTTELSVAAGPKYMSCDGVAFRDGDEIYCFDKARRTWREAEEHCRLIGGHLAYARGPSDSASLRRAFGTKVPLPATLWIGLVEPFQRNQWFWMSGSRGLPYQNWAPGEPNDAGGGEDCGERISRTGQWNDIDCAATRAFLCEGPTAVPGTSPTTLGQAGFNCTGKVILAGSTAYCLHTERELTLSEADQFCKAEGGKMAELDTAEKDQALFAELGPSVGSGDDVWIGLTDGASEGTWVSSEGAPLRFFEWRKGEPNNVGPKGEDCATWGPSDGKWNDLPCDARAESICRGPADPGERL